MKFLILAVVAVSIGSSASSKEQTTEDKLDLYFQIKLADINNCPGANYATLEPSLKHILDNYTTAAYSIEKNGDPRYKAADKAYMQDTCKKISQDIIQKALPCAKPEVVTQKLEYSKVALCKDTSTYPKELPTGEKLDMYYKIKVADINKCPGANYATLEPKLKEALDALDKYRLESYNKVKNEDPRQKTTDKASMLVTCKNMSKEIIQKALPCAKPDAVTQKLEYSTPVLCIYPK